MFQKRKWMPWKPTNDDVARNINWVWQKYTIDWHFVDGKSSRWCPFQVITKILQSDQFLNVHNPVTSYVFSCNTNIQIGQLDHLFGAPSLFYTITPDNECSFRVRLYANSGKQVRYLDSNFFVLFYINITYKVVIFYY